MTKTIVCISLLGAAGAVAAELTVEQALDRALRRNLGLQVVRDEPELARQTVAAARADFAPTLQAGGKLSEQRAARADEERQDGAAAPVATRGGMDIGVTKKTVWGTEVGLTGDLARDETEAATATLDPAHQAGVAVTLRQPLLRGAGRDVNELAIRQGRIAVRRADLAVQASVMDLLRDTERAYWTAVAATEEVAVRRASLAAAEQTAAEARAKQDAGLATAIDALQAETTAAARRDALVTAEAAAKDRRDELERITGRLALEETPLAALTTNWPAPPAAVPPLPALLDRARRRQPEYLRQQETLNGRRLETGAARADRQPALDLSGQVGYAGRGGDRGDALSGAADGDGYNWQVEMRYQMPWGLGRERARYRRALLEETRDRLRLEDLEQQLTSDIRAAGRALETGLERLRAAGLARELAEKQVELETARFNAGLATVRNVLDAQTDLDDARLREVRARLDVVTAQAQLARLEGGTLERHGLSWNEVDARSGAGEAP